MEEKCELVHSEMKEFLLARRQLEKYWKKLTRIFKKLYNILQEDPLIQKYARLTTLDTKFIMIKTKSWECMGKCMSVLEIAVQGRSLAMLQWRRKTVLSFRMRYIGIYRYIQNFVQTRFLFGFSFWGNCMLCDFYSSVYKTSW